MGGRGLEHLPGVCGGLLHSYTESLWNEGTTWSSSAGLGVDGSTLLDKERWEGRDFFGGSKSAREPPQTKHCKGLWSLRACGRMCCLNPEAEHGGASRPLTAAFTTGATVKGVFNKAKGLQSNPEPCPISKCSPVIMRAITNISSNLSQRREPNNISCESLDEFGLGLALVMKYAVDEINANQMILPGIKLGYEIYDTCRQSAVVVKPTMSFLTAKSNKALHVQCDYTNYETSISAVIGPLSSEMVSVIGKLLGFFLMPQVSFGATSDKFSNKLLYPSFFRTVPSDKWQVDAMVFLLKEFHWNWVAVVGSEEEYGQQAVQDFSKTAEHMAVIRRNVTAVWIGSTSWIISARLTALPNIQTVGTIIGFMDKTQDLNLLTAYTEELFTKLSEERANTTPPAQRSPGVRVNPCPQCWNLSPANLSLVTGSGVKHTSFNVYAAIYSVAQALHNLLGCNSTACEQGPKTKILPWKVPESTCSGACGKGQVRRVKGFHSCCFDCIDCLPGTYRANEDDIQCTECPERKWSSTRSNNCTEPTFFFLSWDTPEALEITLAVVVLLVCQISVGVMFLKHWRTPLVSASGGALGFVALLSLMGASLSLLLFLGQPGDVVCRMQLPLTSIFQTVVLSIMTSMSLQVRNAG
ncbi:Taste receptor type 1 member 3 [Liparis tanakae]|uniref:Taste receptor type 1 member 3 n=1 Tax=Liparis tanakae TaxID=230148 RepID=A0A4Z2HMP6_9TELE|nr:Taste receptor type 1 member 3 [Liparis tanakae]